jgi:peptidoglycan hydrolase-like protein with peptidoglycan-binding domain
MDYEEQAEAATPNSSVLNKPSKTKASAKKAKDIKPTATVYEKQPTLYMNMRGDLVKLWQRSLAKLANIDLEVSGYYGYQTHQATALFQKTFGLKPTGNVDQETWKLLAYLENAEL